MSLVLRAVAGVALLAVVLAGVLYASDYGVQATITDKGQDSGGRFVVATTKLGGLQHREYVPVEQWLAVQEGFFVVYHLQSSKMEVYDREGGRLIFQT